MTRKNFGRYQIKSELGRGGMATVYHAYDPRFKRDIALKVLPPEFLHDPNFRARFEREAQTIASLEHPAIVPVYDFGEEEGQPFLVMRFLAGGSLLDRLKGGALAVDETAAILNHLAPAIDEAHRQGIIHRDLKPANILFDHHHMPYIADFGIAKLTTGNRSLTSGAYIIGTPDYMSPEQASGEKIDGRSDIYALGVILFEILSGELPYNAETPIGLLMKHINDPVPSILAVKSDLPPGCEAVILKAMAKAPADRYPTVTAMALAFQYLIRGETPPEVDELPIFGVAPAPATPPLQRSSQARPYTPASTSKGRLQQLVCPSCGASLPGNLRPNQPVECASCGSRFMMAAPQMDDTLVCPHCQTVNAIELRYCVNCGQSLKVDCVLCHTSNPVGATHCFSCGANLAAAQARREESLETRRRQREERQQALLAKETRQRQEKIERLLDELGQPEQQRMAIYQLNQLGNDALPGLMDAVLSRIYNARTRAGAAKVMGEICDKQEVKSLIKARVAKVLIKALEDPEPTVRYWAAEALSIFKGQLGQSAVEPLGKLLKDKNDEVRQRARQSLQQIGGARAEEILNNSKGLMGWLKG
jgi:serine/threonine-protein kinase